MAFDIMSTHLNKLIREAIKEWVRIDLKNTNPIVGGVSGAGVHYVSAELSFPGLTQDKIPIDCVVKFSDKRTFRIEQEKYDGDLTDKLKQYFINFSAITRQVSDEFCMVMEHLQGFQTLETLLYMDPIPVGLGELIKKVISVLGLFRTESVGSTDTQSIRRRLNVFRLYLVDIAENMFQALMSHPVVLKDLYGKNIVVNGLECDSIKKSFNVICEKWKNFESDSITLMHGDCHARNIMVNPRTLDLKFIDIDRLDKDGDHLYDFGELLADLEIFGYILGNRRFKILREGETKYSYSIDPPNVVNEASKMIMNALTFPNEKDKMRLELAKARYLLSMIPNLSKYNTDKILGAYLESVRIMHYLVQHMLTSRC